MTHKQDTLLELEAQLIALTQQPDLLKGSNHSCLSSTGINTDASSLCSWNSGGDLGDDDSVATTQSQAHLILLQTRNNAEALLEREKTRLEQERATGTVVVSRASVKLLPHSYGAAPLKELEKEETIVEQPTTRPRPRPAPVRILSAKKLSSKDLMSRALAAAADASARGSKDVEDHDSDDKSESSF